MPSTSRPRAGRPEAAAAIWRWQETEPEEASDSPSAGTLRIRGTVQGGVGIAFGAALRYFGFPTLGTIVTAIASLIALTAILSPKGVYASVHRLFLATGRVVGRGMTWVVMVPIFYGVFLPFGLLFRHGRRDRMKRYYDSDAQSYWEKRPKRPAGYRERPY